MLRIEVKGVASNTFVNFFALFCRLQCKLPDRDFCSCDQYIKKFEICAISIWGDFITMESSSHWHIKREVQKKCNPSKFNAGFNFKNDII